MLRLKYIVDAALNKFQELLPMVCVSEDTTTQNRRRIRKRRNIKLSFFLLYKVGDKLAHTLLDGSSSSMDVRSIRGVANA